MFSDKTRTRAAYTSEATDKPTSATTNKYIFGVTRHKRNTAAAFVSNTNPQRARRRSPGAAAAFQLSCARQWSRSHGSGRERPLLHVRRREKIESENREKREKKKPGEVVEVAAGAVG